MIDSSHTGSGTPIEIPDAVLDHEIYQPDKKRFPDTWSLDILVYYQDLPGHRLKITCPYEFEDEEKAEIIAKRTKKYFSVFHHLPDFNNPNFLSSNEDDAMQIPPPEITVS